MKKVLLSVIISLSAIVSAQEYSDIYGEELFFKSLPGSRTVSLGGTGNVTYDGISSVFYNPALICKTGKFDLYLQKNSSSYNNEDSDISYGGTGFKIFKKLAFGFLVNNIDTRNSTLSVGFKANRALSLGINANMIEFTSEENGSETDERFFSMDVGIHSIIGVSRSYNFRQRTSIGVSLKNLIGQKYNGRELPMILSGAVEFAFLPNFNNPFSNTLKSLMMTFSGEFSNSINCDQSELGGGCEFLISEVLSLRFGYKNEELYNNPPLVDPVSDSDNEYKGSLSSFTYGGGISLPFYRFEGLDIPVKLDLDYSYIPDMQTDSDGLISTGENETYSLKFSWVKRRIY